MNQDCEKQLFNVQLEANIEFAPSVIFLILLFQVLLMILMMLD